MYGKLLEVVLRQYDGQQVITRTNDEGTKEYLGHNELNDWKI